MRELVLGTIRDFRMIQAGDVLAVGCSGGADSTALLLLLKELSESLGCVLSVAHLNHCLRGSESDADEEFVRRLAENLGLTCYAHREAVAMISRRSRTNQEAQARELRLQFFESLIQTGKAGCIALAHTADDQAETVLQRLLRGAGTRGLTGIYPVMRSPSRKMKIIRPLLRLRRAALRQWLTNQGQGWREDTSNQDLRRVRNRVRHQLLPLLEQFNPRIVEILSHTAAIAREEEEFWKSYIEPLCDSWIRWEDGQAKVDLACLQQAPPAVAYRVLRWVLGKVSAGAPMDRTSQPRPTDFLHVAGLYKWSLEGQSGQQFSLPQKVEAWKEFSHLILRKQEKGVPWPAVATSPNYCYTVQVPCTVRVTEIGRAFRFEFIALEEGQARYNDEGSILLDAKLAEFPLSLRNWQRGDAYLPGGHRSPRKLQDLFQRKRIPAHERAGWPVLWAGEQIVWARGMAVAAGWSPSPESHQAVGIHEIS